VSNSFQPRPLTTTEKRLARRGVTRKHGRPMLCPQCGNDIFIDGPHICPEGFVRPAREILTFYGYNSLNQCCAQWMLLGWPEVDGRPKIENDERGHMHMTCPKCDEALWFDITNPMGVFYWDTAERGTPPPPALAQGRIKYSSGWSS
jgi:predicted RNA-binding Zn-ribbon protein involved in translation (DUF1610 family)